MCWAWVVLSSSAGILTTAREKGKGDGGKGRRVGEQRGETDPQLEPFIFIATLTDFVGQMEKEQVHLKEADHSEP